MLLNRIARLEPFSKEREGHNREKARQFIRDQAWEKKLSFSLFLKEVRGKEKLYLPVAQPSIVPTAFLPGTCLIYPTSLNTTSCCHYVFL